MRLIDAWIGPRGPSPGGHPVARTFFRTTDDDDDGIWTKWRTACNQPTLGTRLSGATFTFFHTHMCTRAHFFFWSSYCSLIISFLRSGNREDLHRFLHILPQPRPTVTYRFSSRRTQNRF